MPVRGWHWASFASFLASKKTYSSGKKQIQSPSSLAPCSICTDTQQSPTHACSKIQIMIGGESFSEFDAEEWGRPSADAGRYNADHCLCSKFHRGDVCTQPALPVLLLVFPHIAIPIMAGWLLPQSQSDLSPKSEQSRMLLQHWFLRLVSFEFVRELMSWRIQLGSANAEMQLELSTTYDC